MSTTHTPPPVVQPVVQPTPAHPQSAWTTGRVAAAAVAAAAVLASGAMATVAGGIHYVDEDRREGDYLTTDTVSTSSAGHALTVEEIDLDGLSGDWLLGTARLRATSDDGGPVFVGVAPTDDAAAYLDGVAYSEVTELDDVAYDQHEGGAPATAPEDAGIWTAQTSGPGTQTLRWRPSGGDWTVVVMNADGSAGVDVRADVGATAPALRDTVCVLLAVSTLTGAAGLLGLILVLLSVRRRRLAAR